MADILIYNGYILTMNNKREIIPNGAIAVENGKIVAVGQTNKVRSQYPHADHEIDAHKHAILPGFVNTHAHNFQILFKSLGDDMNLMEWAPKAIRPMRSVLTAQDCYWAGLGSSIESIRGGITTTVDFHYANKDPACADRILDAYIKAGIRGIEARTVIDADVFGKFDPEDSIIESLDESLKKGRNFIHKWRGRAKGRVRGWYGPGSVWTSSDEAFQEFIQLAVEENTRFPVHFNETQEEVSRWKRLKGLQPIEYTYKLDPRLGDTILAVHCVWVNEQEITIMQKTDMKVSYNPLSNMYLASGIAPISRLLQEGITVSLGADGQASNNGQDHFELIRTAVLLQKVATLNPQAISAEKGLEMATIDGAKAIGLEDDIGSLEVGKKADIIVFNLSAINMRTLNRIPSQIVYCGKSQNLVHVIIDGQFVLKDNRIVMLNESKIIEEVQKAGDNLITRAGCLDMRKRPWTSLPLH